MRQDSHRHRAFDWPLLIAVYSLAFFGVMCIFSATHNDVGAFYKKQLINIVVGTVSLIAASLLDYHLLIKFTRPIYGFNLLLLIAVKVIGAKVNGSGRWFRLGLFQIQPSEFAKLFLIITLAFFLAKVGDKIKEPKTLLTSLLHILLPAVLILRQPDLGTALVVIAVWAGMVFIAGAKVKHLALLFLTGIAISGLAWNSGLIKEYQKERIRSMMNTEESQKSTGYQVYQAKIAIGSGQMWGKGFLHGTQGRDGYIPEKQTDFIFSTIMEEWGFVGAIGICLAYILLLTRAAQIGIDAIEDPVGRLIVTGIFTMLLFHLVVNIGMNVGILPVAGVPLSLISYGGSSMLVTLTCIGFLQSVVRHRHQLLF